MNAISEVAPQVGVRAACGALDVARASYYRAQRPQIDPAPRKSPPRALSNEERVKVLDVLHSERFVDKSPAETWATLLETPSARASPARSITFTTTIAARREITAMTISSSMSVNPSRRHGRIGRR